MKWLDRLDWKILIFAAVILAILPWPRETQPHLLQKLGMLMNGTLSKPIDIFDLLMHGTPAVLVVLKMYRHLKNRKLSQEP